MKRGVLFMVVWFSNDLCKKLKCLVIDFVVGDAFDFHIVLY